MEKQFALTTGEAARALGIGVDRMRQLDASGEIQAIRTTYNMRLFRAEDVEALRVARLERSKQAQNRPVAPDVLEITAP